MLPPQREEDLFLIREYCGKTDTHWITRRFIPEHPYLGPVEEVSKADRPKAYVITGRPGCSVTDDEEGDEAAG